MRLLLPSLLVTLSLATAARAAWAGPLEEARAHVAMGWLEACTAELEAVAAPSAERARRQLEAVLAWRALGRGTEVRAHLALASYDLAQLEADGDHGHGPTHGEVGEVPAPAPPVGRTLSRGVTPPPEPAPPTRTVRLVRAESTVEAGAPERPRRRVRRVPSETPDVPTPGGGEVWQYPVREPRITSHYGPRIDPITGQRGRMHRGTDFGAPTGTPIYAPLSGEVLLAGWCSGGTGNCVVLEHADGWRSQYFHLSSWEVRAGQQVAQGEKLGEVGSTGRSTGPHLHFQVAHQGQDRDPEELFGTVLAP